MSPRERVLAAINHERPDRVPCDFWAEEPTWHRLLAHLGHNDREQALRSLSIDMRHMTAVSPPERPVDGAYQNMWGERYVYQATPWGPMREDVKGALAEAQSLGELESFPWPGVDAMDMSHLRSACEEHEGFALLYGFADVWQRPALVRGWEGMFLDMVERPEWVHYLCGVFTDFYVEEYTRAAEISNGRIDLYLVLSDLGSQVGPLFSLRMFRELVAPYLGRMFDHVHSLGARVLYHSCGDITQFIPDLVSLGVDVLDPIQPVNQAMAPEALASAFGGQVCFHGGIDMQRVLPSASPAEVRCEAERYCQALGKNGGYILGPAHLFQPDVPPENIVAVYGGITA